MFKTKKKLLSIKSGVRTHAHIRELELKSSALDRSAILTAYETKLF